LEGSFEPLPPAGSLGSRGPGLMAANTPCGGLAVLRALDNLRCLLDNFRCAPLPHHIPGQGRPPGLSGGCASRGAWRGVQGSPGGEGAWQVSQLRPIGFRGSYRDGEMTSGESDVQTMSETQLITSSPSNP